MSSLEIEKFVCSFKAIRSKENHQIHKNSNFLFYHILKCVNLQLNKIKLLYSVSNQFDNEISELESYSQISIHSF